MAWTGKNALPYTAICTGGLGHATMRSPSPPRPLVQMAVFSYSRQPLTERLFTGGIVGTRTSQTMRGLQNPRHEGKCLSLAEGRPRPVLAIKIEGLAV